MGWDAVIGSAGSEDIAKGIANSLGIGYASMEIIKFKDGEFKVRLGHGFGGKNLIFVHRLFPDPSQKMLELIISCRAMKNENAHVHAVLPYMSYARQDKEFVNGEVVTLRVLAQVLREAGVDEITTVDIHSAEGLKLFDMKVNNRSAMPVLAQYAKSLKLDNVLVASPDYGGIERSREFAREIDAEAVAFEKFRDRNTGEISMNDIDIDASDKNVFVIDDMIATGGSIAKVSTLLKKHGAKKVIAIATHGLLVDNAEERILGAGADEIITTNTILNPHSKVDIAPLLYESLKKEA
ncbi:MAG: ribose-phosphate diphosphokinase [Candidatus Micrarchaeia archaeon]